MQQIQSERVAAHSLRFAFDDAVISLTVAPGATFEDVALLWGEMSVERHGNPVDIKLTFASLGAPRHTPYFTV